MEIVKIINSMFDNYSVMTPDDVKFSEKVFRVVMSCSTLDQRQAAEEWALAISKRRFGRSQREFFMQIVVKLKNPLSFNT